VNLPGQIRDLLGQLLVLAGQGGVLLLGTSTERILSERAVMLARHETQATARAGR
jgi:hypothetical protein